MGLATMRAVCWYGPGEAQVGTVPVPEPGPGQVVVRVHVAGLCGTDLAVYSGRYPGVRAPLILGHEYAGVVAAVGPSVAGLREGDRVTSEGSWSCGQCADCLSGEPARCRFRRLLGRSVDGVFAEYARVPASICHRLPDSISDERGQALVAVATVYRAMARARLAPGEPVAIVGLGHSGLTLLQALPHAGAGRIVCLGTRPPRIQLAKDLGAETVVNVRDPDYPRWLAGAEQQGGIADLVFECSGSYAGLDDALRLTRTGGRVLVYSIYGDRHPGFDASQLYHKELTLIGSRGGAGDYDAAMTALNAGLVKPERLITHRFSLDEIPRALALACERPATQLRVTFHFFGAPGIPAVNNP